MSTHIPALAIALALSTFISVDSANAEPIEAFRGARILTATGVIHDPGVLIVENGKIIAIGTVGNVKIPKEAAIRDLSGLVIIPGLVDSHSHLGVTSRPIVPSNRDGSESTGAIQSIVRALDSLNPFDPGIRMANAGGLTTANIMPGSSNVIGGQTIYVKLRGRSPEEMWIASNQVLGGLKMANGENPKRTYGRKNQPPGSRMKIAAMQRAEFLKAQDYLRKWEHYSKESKLRDNAKKPDVDLGLQAIVEVLQKRRTVHFHTHRADDILTVLRLKREFGFELVIQHGTEGFKVIDEIAKANVPVSMTIVDSPGGKAEVVDFVERTGAELTAAGVKVHVNTDDPITESRFFLRTTATTIRGGLSPANALKAITLYPAQALHLDHRLGSLETGKDADFVILNGEPFSIYTRVLETFIDGNRVFNLNDKKQRLFQTGGFAILDPSRVPRQVAKIKSVPSRPAPPVPAGATRPNADSGDILILAGRLHTVANGTINDGVVLVRDGKIAYVGTKAGLKVTNKSIPVISAAAVTPGFIDAYSVVPLAGEYNIPADQDQDETSDPNQADTRVIDGFNPAEPLMRYLLEQGITVIHACPGRANAISGLTGVFRTHGRTAEKMTVRFPQAMLFNLGASPKQTYKDRRPNSRMGTASLIREALNAAANYLRKQESRKADEPQLDRNLKHEAMKLVLQRKIPAMFCAHRADDILTALRISREFNCDPVIALATEGYLITEELAKSNVPIVVHPTMQRVAGIETYHTYLGNAAALADAKVRIAIGSGVEGYVPKTRVIRFEAALAMVYGLGFDRALKSVTLDAARILKIDNQFGSIEVGKTADLVLFDGDPFEHATHVTHVLVDGRLVHRRQDRRDIPLAQRLFFFSPEIPCCLW